MKSLGRGRVTSDGASLNSRLSGTDELPLFVSLWFYRKRGSARAPPRGAPYTSGALHGSGFNTDGVIFNFL